MPRRRKLNREHNTELAPRPRVIHCVDLFAGAGGFSLAAKRAGMKVVAAVELDHNACKTYRRNLAQSGGARLYEADITKLNPSVLVRDCKDSGGQCDVVLGGPPCQGFSVHRINDSGKDDPRNQLIHRYFEYVRALKPRAFLMENVPGMLWARHAAGLQKFYLEAAAAGYQATSFVLDGRDYGLPQRRKRVFILGLRSDVPVVDWLPPPSHGSPLEVEKNPKLRSWNSCAWVFKKKIRKADPNNVHMQHSAGLVTVFKSTPPNGGSRADSNRVLPCHKEHNGHKDVYGRIDPSQPAPTMTTACINPSKGRFLHPTKHHGISLRHAARLQGFPDSFVFEGGLMAGGIQVGNAVPIPLGEILLRNLAALLKGQASRKPANDSSSRPRILEAAE